jgi:hypothetical protein
MRKAHDYDVSKRRERDAIHGLPKQHHLFVILVAWFALASILTTIGALFFCTQHPNTRVVREFERLARLSLKCLLWAGERNSMLKPVFIYLHTMLAKWAESILIKPHRIDKESPEYSLCSVTSAVEVQGPPSARSLIRRPRGSDYT